MDSTLLFGKSQNADSFSISAFDMHMAFVFVLAIASAIAVYSISVNYRKLLKNIRVLCSVREIPCAAKEKITFLVINA